MALSSMTGFARSDGAFAQWTWHWEAKSVNGRSLELRLRLPPGLDALDPPLRALAQKHLRRGNVQMGLTIESALKSTDLRINRNALAVVISAISELKREPGVGAADPASILSIKGVLATGEEEPDLELLAERDKALTQSAEQALIGLRAARLKEGAELSVILSAAFAKVLALAGEASVQAAAQLPKLRERIQEQLRLLLDQRAGLSEERIAQELALIAVKADVREEIDRLQMHARAGEEMLSADEAVGRRLDFLTQELNREANTVCSKSNDVALTRIGLELKAVIDQVREQVQNVE